MGILDQLQAAAAEYSPNTSSATILTKLPTCVSDPKDRPPVVSKYKTFDHPGQTPSVAENRRTWKRKNEDIRKPEEENRNRIIDLRAIGGPEGRVTNDDEGDRLSHVEGYESSVHNSRIETLRFSSILNAANISEAKDWGGATRLGRTKGKIKRPISAEDWGDALTGWQTPGGNTEIKDIFSTLHAQRARAPMDFTRPSSPASPKPNVNRGEPEIKNAKAIAPIGTHNVASKANVLGEGATPPKIKQVERSVIVPSSEKPIAAPVTSMNQTSPQQTARQKALSSILISSAADEVKSANTNPSPAVGRVHPCPFEEEKTKLRCNKPAGRKNLPPASSPRSSLKVHVDGSGSSDSKDTDACGILTVAKGTKITDVRADRNANGQHSQSIEDDGLTETTDSWHRQRITARYTMKELKKMFPALPRTIAGYSSPRTHGIGITGTPPPTIARRYDYSKLQKPNCDAAVDGFANVCIPQVSQVHLATFNHPLLTKSGYIAVGRNLDYGKEEDSGRTVSRYCHAHEKAAIPIRDCDLSACALERFNSKNQTNEKGRIIKESSTKLPMLIVGETTRIHPAAGRETSEVAGNRSSKAVAAVHCDVGRTPLESFPAVQVSPSKQNHPNTSNIQKNHATEAINKFVSNPWTSELSLSLSTSLALMRPGYSNHGNLPGDNKIGWRRHDVKEGKWKEVVGVDR